MHGHGIRLLAEEEHIDEWADFGAGAIYGVLKRLTAEGLIEELRTEREGNYPERQVYDITPAGSAALDQIRTQALDEIVLRPDPVDLALARLDNANLAKLKETLQIRLAELRSLLTKAETHVANIAMYLTVMEQHIMRHKASRLRGEIEWHEQLLVALPEIIKDEKSRKGRLQ
jgi:DNA-binding PadR family transcriptional regulator